MLGEWASGGWRKKTVTDLAKRMNGRPTWTPPWIKTSVQWPRGLVYPVFTVWGCHLDGFIVEG